MKRTTWSRLDALFARHPVLVAEGVDAREIALAAEAIGCQFHSDYTAFVERYGGAIVGPDPIYGLRQAEAMGRDDVVSATQRFRAQKWPGTDGWYVISMDGGGNPIGMDAAGKVHASYHDGGGVVVLAKSFEEHLLRLLEAAVGR